MSDTDQPQPPEQQPDGPRIGVDEWVARADERTGVRGGRLAPLFARAERIPWWAILAAAVAFTALVPFLSSSDYVVRVAVNTVLFALLALGLNVVVGWTGLLDLGFIAFYGFGAYAYAILSSNQFGLHWPAVLSVTLVIITSALLGLLLGLPSRRLIGRLPGDRDAFLRADLRRDDDERGPDHAAVEQRTDRFHRRSERDHRRRPDQHLRLRVRLHPQLPLAVAGSLRGRRRRAAVSSTTRARAVPGARCARTRSPPR